MATIETIFAAHFDEDAIDRMCARGNELIDAIPLQRPISCVLFDAQGAELARFMLGTSDPTDRSCNEIEAEMRSQNGASLRMVDAHGREAELLLVIGTQTLQ